jgi:flagellar protein FliO/FliZ
MNSMELFPYILKIVSALAVVVGIMIMSIYLMKRIMKKTGGGINDNELINVLSTKYVGPKSSIMLIEVLGNIIVIGLSNSQISVLSRIKDQKSLEQMNDIRRQENSPASFSDHLSLFKKKFLSLGSVVEKDNRGGAGLDI